VTKAINFIASGMDHLDAVRLAEKECGKTPEDDPPEVDISPGKEKDLTDEEWLDTNCRQMLHLLRKKGPFQKDVRWTPLSSPKNGDPSLLSRQALVAVTLP